MSRRDVSPTVSFGYDDALILMERRWMLRIVGRLLDGPLRFGDLLAAFSRLSPNILSQRLSEMAEAGILVRRELPPPAKVQVYELTDKGQALRLGVTALTKWASRYADETVRTSRSAGETPS